MLTRAESSDLWLLAADMMERATGNVYHGLLRRAGYPPPAGKIQLQPRRTDMDFGEAIRALKEDRLVRRAGWNGKNMHLYLEDGLSHRIGDGAFKGQLRAYEPCICMFTAQGKHQPGWLANQQDMLATDWETVDPSGDAG